MRVSAASGDFQARVIAGTRTVLIALDCPGRRRSGLLGFAIGRNRADAPPGEPWWLASLKVFKSVVPDPKNARDPNDPLKPARFRTYEHPVQSFLWGDYALKPDTGYRYTVLPMYGKPGALVPDPALTFDVRTEKDFDQGHGVWFNMGAIASQAFARTFENKAPTDAEQNDPTNPEVRWLARGLLKACLDFIRNTPAGDGLRVAAYEFTYKPVLDELRTALDRGVDVRIIYHDTTTSKREEKAANENAIALSNLPKRLNNKQVLFPRAHTKIPHNKFIIRLTGNEHPAQVWTGSTNFTPSGFLGQTNVGHLVDDAGVARDYLRYWDALKGDPELADARASATDLTPDPPAVIEPGRPTLVFSPRPRADMLRWYGDRIEDAVQTVMFTAAFGVTDRLIVPLSVDRDFLRFILAEKPPTDAKKAKLTADPDVILSYGSVLGEMYTFK
ncbi:MAG: hypothetical protein QOG64_3139, partial [Acidimicrobiaceae bacterium]|nr:hypothetical protein [Acidimicrobiaceae bacterium]